MKAEIKDGNLVLTIALIDPPRPSKSGNTLLVATTGGNQQTNVQVGGKTVVVGCNAFIKP